MIKEYRSIIGTPIIHFEQGTPLALIKDLIIDSDTGKIEAFWIKPLTIPISNAIVQSQDILEWKKNIYIKNDSVIADPSDVIRISDILMKEIYIIGNRVKNEAGIYYGKVYSITLDTENFYLKQIYVQKSFLGIIKYEQRIFSFDNIIEVTPYTIIIKDDSTEKEKIIKTTLAEDPSV